MVVRMVCYLALILRELPLYLQDNFMPSGNHIPLHPVRKGNTDRSSFTLLLQNFVCTLIHNLRMEFQFPSVDISTLELVVVVAGDILPTV
jgi:hypothetical protein